MRPKLIFSFMCIFACAILPMPAQNKTTKYKRATSVLNNYQMGKRVNKAMLDKATKLQYSKGNGSVAPEWHYDYYIDVTRSCVTLTIYRGYDGKSAQTISRSITATQYASFIQHLISQGISKQKADSRLVGLCGAGTEDFIVYMNKKKLIEIDCSIGEDNVAKGSISDSFMSLLNAEQKSTIAALEN